MISQQQWLQSRKKLLQQVKTEVQLRLGPQPVSLRRYAKSLDRELRGRWSRCTLKSLHRAIAEAHVVLGADFHAYAQSQRAHIRLLRALPEGRKVVLALECLPAEHNQTIQEFLSNQISEEEFLVGVEWEAHWGFPWEHYKPLLILAKNRGFQVVGLNHLGLTDLKKRDQWTAREIAAIHKRRPNALIYAVIGEWHLAQSHLPQALRKHFAGPGDLVTVLQDSEDLYFRLARQKQEDNTECLRRPGQRFCVMVSPPWMKWQSYLMYLEQTYDQDLQEELTIDYSDHVNAFVRIMQRDLKMKVDTSKLHVYGPTSKRSLTRWTKGLSARDDKLMRQLLERDRSFLLPQSGLLYLSRPTINHAAAMSGQFVHAQLSGRTRPLWNFPQDFAALIWIEGVAFFFSKWINPKRKAENLDGLRLQLQATSSRDQGREALLLAMEQQMALMVWLKSKRKRTISYRPKQKFSYVEAARILGSVLGENMYSKVRHGQVPLKRLLGLLKRNVECAGFRDSYLEMIAELYDGTGNL